MENMIAAFEQVWLRLQTQKKNAYTACFTGTRPKNLHGYNPAAYDAISGRLAGVISGLYVLGFKNFISGGAQGIDQLACWAVNSVKQNNRPDMKNIVYVPFAAQPDRWAKYGIFSQNEYHEMLSAADTVKILAENPAPGNMGQTVKLLNDRNHAMVENSDLVIAFLTGESLNWQTAKGGTSECVRYAHSHGKPVLAIEYRPGQEELFRLEYIGV